MKRSIKAGENPLVSGLLDRLVSSEPFDRVLSVVLFGSTARGDESLGSDIDILVVVEEAPRAVLAATTGAALTPLVFTAKALLQEPTAKPSFVSHILDEGLLMYERSDWPLLETELAIKASDRLALHCEIRRRVRHLSPLHPVERFRNSPVTAMSHIYAVARSLVIARLLESGVHEYSWKRAFDRYAGIRPELAPDIEVLKALRPYYEFCNSRPGARLPSRSVDLDELRDLVDSAERLAN